MAIDDMGGGPGAGDAAGRFGAGAPDALIKSFSSGDVVDRIKSDKDIQAGDFKLSDLVDSTVMPHVHFRAHDRPGGQRNWRGASADQQKQLMAEFRSLLLRTYSGALVSVKDESIRMKPLRADAADTRCDRPQ